MNAPIPPRPGPQRSDPLPDPPLDATPDTRLQRALALRHECMQLSAELDYFMRHELAEMRAKVAYFSLLCHLSDCRAADRIARR